MQDTRQNRRKEERFEVGGRAVLRSEAGGASYPATIMNVSGGGLFLGLEGPHPFEVGDEVVCEIRLPQQSNGVFASWGMGRVVRLEATGAAIELHTATFDTPIEH